MDTSPEWSCDGSKIVFASNRSGNLDIFTMKPDGTDVTNITKTSWPETDPTYSPDGTKIAYASEQHGDFDIMVMKADGSNASDPLHLTTSVDYEVGPSWSPDGTKIAYQKSSTGSQSDIFVVSATTPDSIAKITNSSGFETTPDWGPASTGETFIYTMKADGTDPQKVTLPITGGYPAWSPDASRIVFSDKGDLFTIMPDGRGLAQLTADHNNTGTDIEPSWSPDGTKMVYVGVDSQGRSSIYTVNVEGGTGLFNVTKGTADRSPVWSPSGTRIAFVRNGNIYSIKPDGTDLKVIKDTAPDRFISLDWGTGGPPDTVITEKPGEAVGDNQATFRFRASRFPASFECRLTSNNGWPGLHDWQDCGSMANSSATEPIQSYSGLAKGHYTFYVRASNEHGQDVSPASWQFESFPPGLTIVKQGTGTGKVTSDPSGIKCTSDQPECSSDKFSGKTVKLSADADKGSSFQKWSGACKGDDKTCTVKVGNKPVFVNAHFELNDTGGYCNEAPETTKQVGPWYLVGCWKGSGTTFTTTEPIKLDGLNLLPKGSTLTLDTSAQTLSASGVVQLNAGPVVVNGRKLGPITLHNDEFEMDLSQAETYTFMPDTTVLGMPVIPAAVIEAGPDGATVSINTTLPPVLGGGDGLLKFFSDRTGGFKWNTIQVGRYSEAGTTNMEYPFAAGIGQIFALEDVTITYSPADGWITDGTVAMAGAAAGDLGGTLTYTNGEFKGGSLTLTNVALGGVVYTPRLQFSSSDGQNWTAAGVGTPRASGRTTMKKAKPKDCGSQVAGQMGINPTGALSGMQFTVPTCRLWGGVVINNLTVAAQLSGFTPRLVLAGTLAGQASGAFTGAINLNAFEVGICALKWATGDFGCTPTIGSVQADLPKIDFDDLLSVSNLSVSGVPDATLTNWNIGGTGDLDNDWYGTGTVDFEVTTMGARRDLCAARNRRLRLVPCSGRVNR